MLSIPVLQVALALPIHLPEGCTAVSGKGGKGPKRLVLSDATLQAIFAHTITKWSQVTAYNSDQLVGASCDKEAPIIRVVRREGSGATSVLEKFLYEINKAAVNGSETWTQLAEQVENNKWPDETENLLTAEKGSGIAAKVASTAGSIGYANLNEVRQNAAFTPAGGGGEGGALFWAEHSATPQVWDDGRRHNPRGWGQSSGRHARRTRNRAAPHGRPGQLPGAAHPRACRHPGDELTHD